VVRSSPPSPLRVAAAVVLEVMRRVGDGTTSYTRMESPAPTGDAVGARDNEALRRVNPPTTTATSHRGGCRYGVAHPADVTGWTWCLPYNAD